METVEYVERFLHHVHAEYLDRSSDAAKTEPVPDDSDEEPRRGSDPAAPVAAQ